MSFDIPIPRHNFLFLAEENKIHPFLIEAPRASQEALIFFWHQELLKIVYQYTSWYEPSFDLFLYSRYEIYYKKIAQLLNPKLDCDRLVPTSRHAFFIFEQDPTTTDEIWGLSGLQKLLGYKASKPTPAIESDLIRATTGYSDLDLLCELAIAFPELTPWLYKRFSTIELRLLLKQNNVRAQGKIDDPDKVKEVRDREFAENKDAIAAAMSAMGMLVPSNFQ